MAVLSSCFHYVLFPFSTSITNPNSRADKRRRWFPYSISLCCSADPDGSKRLSEQSSWESKDSEGKDYLYRLGQEADNMNVSVGARQGVIDDLFVGNFLGKDCASVFPMIAILLPFLLFVGFDSFRLRRSYFIGCFFIFVLQRISSSITGRRRRDRLSIFRAITTLRRPSWFVSDFSSIELKR